MPSARATKRRPLGQRRRARLLAAEPLCRECRRQGRTTPAAEIDHIVPLASGGGDQDDNLQPLCRDCHWRKTATENMRRHRPGLGGACAHGVPAGRGPCPWC